MIDTSNSRSRKTALGKTVPQDERLQRYLGNPMKENGLTVAGFLNFSVGEQLRWGLHLLRLCREVLDERTDNHRGLPPEWEAMDETEVKALGGDNFPFPTAVINLNLAIRIYSRGPLELEIPTQQNPHLRLSSRRYRSTKEQVANKLVQLTLDGSLDRLRQCANCETWFFALRKDQIQCNENCTNKKYRTSDGFKRVQALDQKVRYWSTRESDLRSKIAKLGSPSNRNAEQRQKLKRKLEKAIAECGAAKRELESVKTERQRQKGQNDAAR